MPIQGGDCFKIKKYFVPDNKGPTTLFVTYWYVILSSYRRMFRLDVELGNIEGKPYV